MNKKEDVQNINPGKKGLLLLIFLLIVFIVAVTAGSMRFIVYTANRIKAEQTPLIDTAMQIKVEATTAHLWFEEIISGDPNLKMDDIITHLDKADSYAQTILQAGQNKISGFKLVNSPQLREDTEKVIEKLSQFRKNTLRRWVVKDVAGIGTDIDQKYDAIFQDLTSQVDKVKADLELAIEQNSTDFRLLQTILMAASLAVTVVVGFIIIVLLRKQIKTQNKLLSENQQLKENNQQLQQSNQQLELSMQQRTNELEKGSELLHTEIGIRKLAQEQVEIFKKFAEGSIEGIGMADLDGNITYANPTLARILGKENPKDLDGKNVRKYYKPKDIPKLEKEILPAVIEKGHKTIEMPLVSEDGKVTPLKQSVFLIRDDQGRPFRLANVTTDISELQQTQEELKQHRDHLKELVAERTKDLEKSNEQLQSEIAERKRIEHALRFTQFAVDRSSDAAFWMGQDARLIYVNEAACRSLGYSHRELLNMSVHDVDPLFPPEVWPAHWSDIKQKGSFTLESIHRARDGHEFPVEVAVNFLEFDGKEYNCAFARDITDRKRAEQELTDSLQTSHDIVQTIPSGLFLYQYEHPDKLILLNGNPEAERLTGINLQDSIGKEFNQIWPNAKQAGVTDAYLNVAKTGQSFETEELAYEDQHLKGIFKIRVFCLPGNRLASAFENVTEKKLAEQALQESENRYRSLIEHIPTVSWKSDQNGNTVFISPNVEKVYGYSFEEICEKGQELWFGRIHPEDREKVLKEYQALFNEGQKFDVEYRIQKKDGNWIWLNDKSENIGEQDGVRYAYGTFLDITRRKKAEEALRNSEEMFRSYIDNAPDGVLVVDREGKFIQANKAACRITGYSKEELLNLSIPDILAPESLQAGKDHFNKAISNGYISGEFLCKTKEGRLRYWNVDAVKISEDRFISFVKDITEQKKAEEQLQLHRTELAHAWRLNTMGEMSTGLAHELNQPLCAVLNYAQACSNLIKDKEHINFNRLDESLEQIISQTNLAGEIIRRIRSLIGKRESAPEPVDINDIIREVIDMETSEAGQKSITIKTQMAEQLPAVLADRIEIEQVILNLVRNAFEAMSQTEPHERILTIHTYMTDENKVEVAVRDTGKGLAPDETEKVFDSFFTTTTNGLGVGLSISRTIVQAHKGHLWAESNPDRGATFKFTLPIAGD